MTNCYGASEIINPANWNLERKFGELMVKYYPNVSWLIEANVEGGIMTITIPEIHQEGNQDYGFVVKLDKTKTEDECKRYALWAGCELLERAHISRETGQRSAEKVDRD